MAASLHEKLSASRWIATRRLGSFLASATVSEHFSTLTQNITTIESNFLQCQAQNNGVVVCTATFRVHTRGCHGHDAVQMQAEDLLSTVHACVDSFSIGGTSLQCLQKKCEETSPGPERWSDVAEVCEFGLLFYVGVAGNTSLVDAGTPLGATTVVTPGSAGYLL